MDLKSSVSLNNKKKIPLLGLGTWQASTNDAEKAVIEALRIGYRHIDTAALYGNEEGIGRGIKKSGVEREDIFLVTKLWNSHHHRVQEAFEESLKKLQTDYVDLYLMHFPMPSRVESWSVFEKILKSKKARSIGVSNFTIRHLEEFLKNTNVVPAVNQVEFHPYLYQKDLLEYCKKKGIQLEAYSPLTRGRKLNEKEIVAIAKKHSKTSAQVLLRWCIEKDVVAIPKSVKPARILENSEVFDFKLDKEDMKILDSLDENFRLCWDPTGAP